MRHGRRGIPYVPPACLCGSGSVVYGRQGMVPPLGSRDPREEDAPCDGGPRRRRLRGPRPPAGRERPRPQGRRRCTSAGIEVERVVPVAPRGAGAAPQPVAATAEHVHRHLGAAAGRVQPRGAAVPEHDPLAVLDDPVADVAVGAERVDVERQQAAGPRLAPIARSAAVTSSAVGRWLSASSRHVTRSKRAERRQRRTCRRRTPGRARPSLAAATAAMPGEPSQPTASYPRSSSASRLLPVPHATSSARRPRRPCSRASRSIARSQRPYS